MADPRYDLAMELFQKAYQMQMQGELDLAIRFYKRSIELHPTAEAHTFLGWTYRFQGKLDEAIAECEKAIAVDPTFGNPYNDIGAYLIEQGALDIHTSETIGLVIETQCNYFAPLAFPQTVQAGIRVAHVGSSSVRYEVGIFGDDELCAAKGHFVHVYVDAASRRPKALPEKLKTVLETLR